MSDTRVTSLADCTEFALTLRARPPAVTHGVTALLAALVFAAAAWAGLTRASLVVRAPGRVRPVNVPTRIFNPGHGESQSASAGGRVVEVNYKQGDAVKAGAVLIRLDAETLDNDTVKKKKEIQVGEHELDRLAESYQLLRRQHDVAHRKAEDELAQATEEVRQQKLKRSSDRRLAEVALKQATDEETQHRRLVDRNYVSRLDLTKAIAKVQEEKERLDLAKIPVDEGKLVVLRRAVELTDKEYAVRLEELSIRRSTKKAEVESARIELANLEVERRHAVLRAPMDGVVTSIEVKPGDLLESGKPVVEIAEQGGFYFEADVASEDVGLLKVGLPVRVKLDAFDFQRYGTLGGRVEFIAPDSTVKESVVQTQTPSYLVKVRLDGDEVGRNQYHGKVKLGMAGQADIVTGKESILAILAKRIRQSISLE